MQGKGNGSFDIRVDYPTAIGPTSVAAGDFDNDGDQDLVVANNAKGVDAISILENQGDGTFKAKFDYPTGAQPKTVAVGDLDKDGFLDIVTTNYGADTVSVLKGNGTTSFRSHADYSTGKQPSSLSLADVNSDGFLDVVTGNDEGYSFSVLLNKGLA